MVGFLMFTACSDILIMIILAEAMQSFGFSGNDFELAQQALSITDLQMPFSFNFV